MYIFINLHTCLCIYLYIYLPCKTKHILKLWINKYLLYVLKSKYSSKVGPYFYHYKTCNETPTFKSFVISIYEGRLFVCFVLFVLIRSTEPGCLKSLSWSLWKALKEEGCIALVSWRLDLQGKSFLNIEWFLHWKLN